MNEERGRELGVGLLGFQPLLYISVRPSLCLIYQLSLSHISLHQPDPHPSPTHPTIIFTLLFFIVSFFLSPSLLIFFAFSVGSCCLRVAQTKQEEEIDQPVKAKGLFG